MLDLRWRQEKHENDVAKSSANCNNMYHSDLMKSSGRYTASVCEHQQLRSRENPAQPLQYTFVTQAQDSYNTKVQI